MPLCVHIALRKVKLQHDLHFDLLCPASQLVFNTCIHLKDISDYLLTTSTLHPRSLLQRK